MYHGKGINTFSAHDLLHFLVVKTQAAGYLGHIAEQDVINNIHTYCKASFAKKSTNLLNQLLDFRNARKKSTKGYHRLANATSLAEGGLVILVI